MCSIQPNFLICQLSCQSCIVRGKDQGFARLFERKQELDEPLLARFIQRTQRFIESPNRRIHGQYGSDGRFLLLTARQCIGRPFPQMCDTRKFQSIFHPALDFLSRKSHLLRAKGQFLRHTAAEQLDILTLVTESTGAVMAVLIILVAMSLVSWYIIAMKAAYLSKAKRQSEKFQDVFWKSKRLDNTYKEAEGLKSSPVAQMFRAGYVELTKLKKGEKDKDKEAESMELSGIENVERALRRASVAETTELEKNLSFLATTGATAPFIGLFGTVWGIMHAFVNLSGTATDMGIQTVAGPIAEALIATAIGLVAAIPSVMAYNYFNQKIKVLHADMESFSNDFLNIVKRHFFK